MTTITLRIQHVELEMCTIGGSIEHRLWPAAEFLTSYILQPSKLVGVPSDDDTDSGISPHDRHRHHHPYHNNSIIDTATYQNIQKNVKIILDRNFRSATKTATNGCKVLELGAGIGFTSLELAHHAFHPTHASDNNDVDDNICHDPIRRNVEYLMTDLSSALPLLQRNRDRNFGRWNSSIRVQKLEWGNPDDIENALSWYRTGNSFDGTCMDGRTNDESSAIPLLVLGTDCVYWESLYDILETTIASLLKNAAPNSICLLANVRRWKRDTNFFQHRFGQCTSTEQGRLYCICIHEQVLRNTVERHCGSTNDPKLQSSDIRETDDHDDELGPSQETRQVIRIYAIQWITKDDKP